MATLTSKLITKQMQWTANMTEANHLGAALITKPHVFKGVMDQLFSAKNIYSDNPLTSTLFGTLGEETITSTEWEWELKGANTRPLIVTTDSTISNGTIPAGKNKSSFSLYLDENWFLPGDILQPGGDKKYQVRINSDGGPVRNGTSWKYTVRLVTDDNNLFVPAKYLQSGAQWSKLYSKYEEGAEQSGSTQFSFPISFKNSMSKLRKMYSITDLAHQEVLAVAIPDSTGKYHTSWMSYAEVEFWQQWYAEMERNFWYSRKAVTIDGSTGRPIISGAGLQQQLEDSHIHKYSVLTVDLIEEYLMDIFYGRTKPGQGRKIKAYTGEYGMVQFHKTVQDWMNKSPFVKNIEVFTNKVSSTVHRNAMEGGYQFVRFLMANGAELELVHNPLYDNREINFELDPITGKPVESMRYTFLDFSGESGKPNVKLIKKKDAYSFGYVEGLLSPYGPKKGGSSAHAKDSYEMHVRDMQGTHIQDVTKCGELILARN